MKKLISTILTFAMMVVMVVPASADDTALSATAAYPSATYTVTIPIGVDFGEITKTASSSISTKTLAVKLASESNILDRKVIVAISTTGAYELTSGSEKLAYKVYSVATGGTELANGAEFAKLATVNETITGRVDIDLMDIPAVGSYTDTVTFTISLEAAPVAS